MLLNHVENLVCTHLSHFMRRTNINLTSHDQGLVSVPTDGRYRNIH